jgi:hypothetical protein
MAEFEQNLRQVCRYCHCRTKLPQPTANEREAFPWLLYGLLSEALPGLRRTYRAAQAR